jgi:MFS transporter
LDGRNVANLSVGQPPAVSDRPHTTRTLTILGVAALAFALAQTTLVPALPELMRALHTDESGVSWTLTGYLVAAAVFTPLVGRLGDMYGKRRLLPAGTRARARAGAGRDRLASPLADPAYAREEF